MSSNPLREMVRQLLDLRLLTKSQIKKCLPEKGATGGVPAPLQLLENLQLQGYLTPYQVDRIKHLDYDQLALGDNKLLYANAAGSFARVYRACTIEGGKTVGVKVLRNRWASDPETVALFKREAETGQKLKHPNIVPIYELGSDGDTHYFTMEFIEGGNLRDFLRVRKQLQPEEAVKYAIDMARGLEYAIALGFTHRDLKLSNVLISSTGVARLIDFGLAAEESTLKKVGGENLQQALEYTTLEKGTNAPRNDPRSDLFFLGGILYELLAGQPPYAPTKSREERKQITRYQNVRPLIEVLPQCPLRLAEIVSRLMSIEPDARYSSATALLADLVPLQKQLEQKVAGENQATISRESKKTILFVESRVREQDWVRDYFSSHGYRVLVLSNPKRALERVQEDPPDCFFVIEDGVEKKQATFIKEAMRLSVQNDFAMIILLGEKSKNGNVKKEDQGNVKFLRQPISLHEIRNAVGQLLDKKEKSSDDDLDDTALEIFSTHD